MSDPERFVERWSRLKRKSVKKKHEAEPAPSDRHPAAATAAVAEQEGQDAAPNAGKAAAAVFDPATLPPIESITAGSDIRAFLQSGVPAELTKAALRRLWTTDPAIRDFIGIAENQWDFTDPTAMPGFGPLEATDDVRELVAQAMGKLGLPPPGVETTGPPMPETASAAAGPPDPMHTLQQVPGIPKGNETEAGMSDSVEGHKKTALAAPQHGDARAEIEIAPNRRTHGRALPQ